MIAESWIMIMMKQALYNDFHLPKADLNTRNSTKLRCKASFGWVCGGQLDLLEKKWPTYRIKQCLTNAGVYCINIFNVTVSRSCYGNVLISIAQMVDIASLVLLYGSMYFKCASCVIPFIFQIGPGIAPRTQLLELFSTSVGSFLVVPNVVCIWLSFCLISGL